MALQLFAILMAYSCSKGMGKYPSVTDRQSGLSTDYRLSARRVPAFSGVGSQEAPGAIRRSAFQFRSRSGENPGSLEETEPIVK